MATLLKSHRNLPEAVRSALIARLRAGEWGALEKLPTEAELSAEYGVSRATVRTALQGLHREGLVVVRHGVGTFVSAAPAAVRAGLEELRSMSEIIANQGFQPSIEFHRRELRAATAEEAEALGISAGDTVLALQRRYAADGRLVCFDYGIMDVSGFPDDFSSESISGSVFDYLAEIGKLPTRARATVRPIISHDIGWGEGRPENGLYLLLDQVQYADDGSQLSLSHLYFVEGRYEFAFTRHRV